MPRKILEKVPEDLLQADLERYRKTALELGATDAKIITTDVIVIDERVRAKCMYPKCRWYGTSANCPPNSMDLDLARKIVEKFRYAVFIKLEVPSTEVAGKDARNKDLSRPSQLKIREIVSKIESKAFFDGYHLALGLGEGPCKNAFCPDRECQALITGQPCRHPLKATGSMEGLGMDAFMMAAKVGWDIYPIGASVSPSEVPFGNKLGLVLIY
jgi:predicted metal-binding protein